MSTIPYENLYSFIEYIKSITTSENWNFVNWPVGFSGHKKECINEYMDEIDTRLYGIITGSGSNDNGINSAPIERSRLLNNILRSFCSVDTGIKLLWDNTNMNYEDNSKYRFSLIFNIVTDYLCNPINVWMNIGCLRLDECLFSNAYFLDAVNAETGMLDSLTREALETKQEGEFDQEILNYMLQHGVLYEEAFEAIMNATEESIKDNFINKLRDNYTVYMPFMGWMDESLNPDANPSLLGMHVSPLIEKEENHLPWPVEASKLLWPDSNDTLIKLHPDYDWETIMKSFFEETNGSYEVFAEYYKAHINVDIEENDLLKTWEILLDIWYYGDTFPGSLLLNASSWISNHRWTIDKPILIQLVPNAVYEIFMCIARLVDQWFLDIASNTEPYCFTFKYTLIEQLIYLNKLEFSNLVGGEGQESYISTNYVNYQSTRSSSSDYSIHTQSSHSYQPYILQELPIGFVYISCSNEDPQTLLGYGTWENISEGRTLVCINALDDNLNEVKINDGEKTHAINSNEIPLHTHGCTKYSTNNGNPDAGSYTGGTYNYWKGNSTNNSATSSTIGSGLHNNLSPYTTVYMFERTC